MKPKHFEMLSPAATRNPARTPDALCPFGGSECRRSDAETCTVAAEDVICTGETYRGCYVGQADCADQPGNPDDVCCWGWGPGVGDNIDHANCIENDAPWGETCFIWDGGNPPTP